VLKRLAISAMTLFLVIALPLQATRRSAESASASVPPQPPATEVPLPSPPNHTYVTIPTRLGVTQGFLLVEPPKALASLIVFVGGSGEILPGGALARSQVGTAGMTVFAPGGLFMSVREQLAALGFRIAIVDVPSDQSSLDGFRTTPEHAQDIRAVIAYLKHRDRKPVWLVASSRGSVSAASVAASLQDSDAPEGIVLASSILREAGGRDPTTVFDVPLAKIRIPVLILHHEQDACPATPFAAVPELVRALSGSLSVQVRSFTGGDSGTGNPCGSTHHHGFVGQTDTVVASVGRYIRTSIHFASKAAHP
jgi:pimeloyl-ACP methyl ester carboxylesterase